MTKVSRREQRSGAERMAADLAGLKRVTHKHGPLWLRPYIRRATLRERTNSIRMSLKLAVMHLSGKPFYVLVQRGHPNLVLACGSSREAIVNTIFGALFLDKPKRNSKNGRIWSGKSFRDWAIRVQTLAGGRAPRKG